MLTCDDLIGQVRCLWEEVRNILRMWSILKVLKLSKRTVLSIKFLSVINTLAYLIAGSMTAKLFFIIELTVSLTKCFSMLSLKSIIRQVRCLWEEVRNLPRMWNILKVLKLSKRTALARKFLSVTNILAYSAAESMTAKLFYIIGSTMFLDKMFFNIYIRGSYWTSLMFVGSS
jgi:hypothetical protein